MIFLCKYPFGWASRVADDTGMHKFWRIQKRGRTVLCTAAATGSDTCSEKLSPDRYVVPPCDFNQTLGTKKPTSSIPSSGFVVKSPWWQIGTISMSPHFKTIQSWNSFKWYCMVGCISLSLDYLEIFQAFSILYDTHIYIYIYIVELFYAFFKIVWVYTNYIISLIFESLRHGSLAVWRHFRIDRTGPGGAWAQHGTATALRAEHRGGKGIFHATYWEKRDKSRT